MTINNQRPNRIRATVPNGTPPGNYQVVVTNDGGLGAESPIGVTLTVGVQDSACPAGDVGDRCGVRPDGGYFAVHNVTGPAAYPATPIQDAIDAAAAGDLIMVPPGNYDELVTMYKPVKLQGWGAAEVILNARQVPTNKALDWRNKVAGYLADTEIDRLPGQNVGVATGFPGLDEAIFPTEEGAAIFVTGKQAGTNQFGLPANQGARIDGFTILGASTGGGIVVNGYSEYLQIANNRVTGNAGSFGGGIRVGHPQLSHPIVSQGDPMFNRFADVDNLPLGNFPGTEDIDYNGNGTLDDDPQNQLGDFVYDDAVNNNIRIHHNHIVKNGAFGGSGAGVSLYTGADNYEVSENFVCGNFSQGNGAGIAHLGLSDGGLIKDNFIIFNESFAQATAQNGGGIFIGGQAPIIAAGTTVSPGAGNVTVDSNVIRGNLAGAGDGGGISLAAVNGDDVGRSLQDRSFWYGVDINNNMITNNVAGLAGGGIAISDALKVSIQNDTVANNDSIATTANAFVPGTVNMTLAQPAGIVAREHSGALVTLMTNVTDAGLPINWESFSDPVLSDSIVLHNRSFYWTNYGAPGTVTDVGLVPSSCDTPTAPVGNPLCNVADAPLDQYTWDLAVLDGGVLSPEYSLLSSFTNSFDLENYSGSNNQVTSCAVGDPNCDFVLGYFNGARDNLNIPEFTTLQTAAALDEAGNFIQVTFGPLSLLELDGTRNNAEGDLLDYHLNADGLSNAVDNGDGSAALPVDFDDDLRPQGSGPDMGADELVPVP